MLQYVWKVGEYMEKERGAKVIAIVALLVGIVGLSIGFAAFSRDLNISSGGVVTPDASTFKVQFSNSESTYGQDSNLVVTPNNETYGDVASISAVDNTTITNLNAKFKLPGDSVSYTFYVHNTGLYDAFLKSITFAAVSGSDKVKVCNYDANNTSADMAEAACASINISVQVGEGTNSVTASSTSLNISTHKLEKGKYEKVVVTISYTDHSAVADGDFNVQFGDIKLHYSTV